MKLYGRRPVYERVKANPQTIKKILEDSDFYDSGILNLAREKKIRVEKIHPRQFYKLSHGKTAQGIIAEVEEYNYVEFDDIVSLPDENKPILIFLDCLSDPQNLGSILRTLACIGGFCIVLPKRDTVEVTESVLRVASGGENYVPICLVSNLSTSIQRAKKEGYTIASTIIEGGKNLDELCLDFPLGIIFGSEGEGIRPVLERYVDYKLTLPMYGAKLSFNVAVTVAIVCYEVDRQRRKT